MASGDAVVQILKELPPAANAAAIAYRAGGSTPAENFWVYEFDPTTVEYRDYLCKLEGYEGGGLTFTIVWSAKGTTTGNVIWSIAIRYLADDADDVDDSHTYVYQDITNTAPDVDGEIKYPTLDLTAGAQIDNWVDGELAIVRIRRRADQGGDTMNSNDAQLWAILGLET